jgi:hypothetical protein
MFIPLFSRCPESRSIYSWRGAFLGAAPVIAWPTVIVHAAHVARANPIHALRYE